jgi:hypothetical protein
MEDYLRRFGGSTGSVLVALGNAMQWPGTKFPIIDVMLFSKANGMKNILQLKKKAENIIILLKLQNVKVFIEDNRCFIISKNYGYINESNKEATAQDWNDKSK